MVPPAGRPALRITRTQKRYAQDKMPANISRPKKKLLDHACDNPHGARSLALRIRLVTTG
ncbi:hypothetical protein BH24ACT5_BH24ACT5_00140 [soil metagenome]